MFHQQSLILRVKKYYCHELELVQYLLLIFFKNKILSLYKTAVNYLLSPFLMLFILLILILKNLNTMFYSYI